jgi:hypothetical protein
MKAGNGAAVAVGSAQTCAGLSALLVGGALPAGVSFVAPVAPATGNLAGCTVSGAVDTSCKVVHSSGTTTAGFTVPIICTSN